MGTTSLEIIHPEYRLLENDREIGTENQLTAVYPTTKGLQQPRIRKLIEQALLVLNHNKNNMIELLPKEILSEQNLPTNNYKKGNPEVGGKIQTTAIKIENVKIAGP